MMGVSKRNVKRGHRQEVCALMNRIYCRKLVDRATGARHLTEERRSCELRSCRLTDLDWSFFSAIVDGLVDCSVALWNLFRVYLANKHKGFI